MAFIFFLLVEKYKILYLFLFNFVKIFVYNNSGDKMSYYYKLFWFLTGITTF